MGLHRDPDIHHAGSSDSWLVDDLPFAITRVQSWFPGERTYWRVQTDGEFLRHRAFLHETGLSRQRFPTRKAARATLELLLDQRAKPLPPLTLPRLRRVSAGLHHDPTGDFAVVREAFTFPARTVSCSTVTVTGWQIKPRSTEAKTLLGTGFAGDKVLTLHGAARALATRGYTALRWAREDAAEVA